MSRKFKITKNFWGNRNIFSKGTVTIEPGFTTLVGCNGSGESTLILNMMSILNVGRTPFISFDNLTEGGSNATNDIGFHGDMYSVAERLQSSEGENIWINLVDLAEQIGNKVRECRHDGSEELWIFLDAIDSGLSIDKIVELKKFFNMVLEDVKDESFDAYIICAANEYELVKDSMPLDVISLKYVSINSYNKYYSVIMRSAKKKKEFISEYVDGDV